MGEGRDGDRADPVYAQEGNIKLWHPRQKNSDAVLFFNFEFFQHAAETAGFDLQIQKGVLFVPAPGSIPSGGRIPIIKRDFIFSRSRRVPVDHLVDAVDLLGLKPAEFLFDAFPFERLIRLKIIS